MQINTLGDGLEESLLLQGHPHLVQLLQELEFLPGICRPARARAPLVEDQVFKQFLYRHRVPPGGNETGHHVAKAGFEDGSHGSVQSQPDRANVT